MPLNNSVLMVEPTMVQAARQDKSGPPPGLHPGFGHPGPIYHIARASHQLLGRSESVFASLVRQSLTCHIVHSPRRPNQPARFVFSSLRQVEARMREAEVDEVLQEEKLPPHLLVLLRPAFRLPP